MPLHGRPTSQGSGRNIQRYANCRALLSYPGGAPPIRVGYHRSP
ncbi:MAG: hypothetical protein DLM70_09400 [Chloroflexi bacterium]|nr:MAG: hypothetical protein DLM70_09400 [Chloroflexota bacterium]